MRITHFLIEIEKFDKEIYSFFKRIIAPTHLCLKSLEILKNILFQNQIRENEIDYIFNNV